MGFRYTTSSLATRFDLTGYVQNLRDGRVRVVVEGAKAELDRFLGVVSDRMGQYIDDTSEETSPATGEFEDFGVRF